MQFPIESIKRTRKALKDTAAGNSECTMTDLDFACNMLDELILIKKNASQIKNILTGKPKSAKL